LKDRSCFFEDQAKLDISEAYDWYLKNASLRVAESFLNEIEESVNYIVQDGLLFKKIHKDYRQVPIKIFPFVIIYKLDTYVIKIYRIFSTNKDPNSKIL